MAFTAEQNQAIKDYVAANIDNPAAIASAAAEFGVSAQALATAVGVAENEVINYFDNAGVAPPSAVYSPKPESAYAPDSSAASRGASVLPANYDQAYVNNLVRQAATQVGGSLSYSDLLRAASNLGISQDKINAAVSTGVITGVPSSVAQQTTASGPSWDYNKYFDSLKAGNADYNKELGKIGGMMGQNAQNIYREILAQQGAGTSEFWSKGYTASPKAAAADFALRLAENGIGSLNQLSQTRTVLDLGEEGGLQDNTVLINKATGQPLPRPELLGRGTKNLGIDYNLSFAADGTVIPFTSNRQSSWTQFREDTLKPAAAFALSTVGAPLIGAAVAPGLAAATQGAIGGAIAGGGTAALTGGNVLQGALLGGAGGYLSGANAAPTQESIYSLANGTPNLNYMGGGQGLTSTGAANLASMGGGQGLQILAGLPSSTLAEALATFGGVNPSILESMGLGSGITYVTPTGIVTENGTIIGGDIISELGKNTGFNLSNWLNENVGVGIGDTLNNVNTGVNSGLFSGVGVPSTGTTTGGATGGLTAGTAGNLIKAGLGLAGTLGTTRAVTRSGSTNAPTQAPTQGVPTNDANYYNQLQQYYNAYLPQTPRDVVTPLQQWYNSKSGA